MAGAVIQATGRLIFEDGMRSFDQIPGPEGDSCVRTNLSEVLVGVGGAGGVGYRANTTRPNIYS